MAVVRSHSRDLVVTACGLASSLGAGWMASCAAARAGVRRARIMSELTFASVVDGSALSPIGHSADLLTRGFEGFARELRLLQAGLADVVRQAWPDAAAPPADAAFYLSIPDPRRIYVKTDLIASEARRAQLRALAAEADVPEPAERATRLLERAAELLGWPRAPCLAFVTAAGRTGVTEALAAAARDLATGEHAGPAIVGGYDCLLDAPTLAWLNELGRLKHADNPVGVEPGEAAAFVVVGTEEASRLSSGRPRAYLCSAHLEGHAGGRGPGVAMTAAIEAAHAKVSDGPPRWLLCDHDGTAERATDVGQAVVRLVARWPGTSPHIDYPPLAFGDVGAATGAVASCLALAAWDRGWARAPIAVIAAAEDVQQVRGAHVLQAAPRM